MLKLNLMILSLMILPLITKNYWWIIKSSLMLITPLSMLVLSKTYMSITYFSGSDIMSSILVTLSIWISAMMMMASMSIKTNMKSPVTFTITNIILLFILMNCFYSSNMMLFYIWFEASLVPTMILIMTWGYQPERIQASMYLMLYTITASLPMLLMFCLIYKTSSTMLMTNHLSMMLPLELKMHNLAWLIMIAGFLVKLPMFSMHLWLPKAHVEAPIAGSMVLAAILLKLGGYGLARMFTIFPHTCHITSSMLTSLAITGASVTSLICMRQPDLKSLIAYSSVGHMGLMLAGMLSNTAWGLSGALIMMIAHGLSSSSMFIMANLSYEMTSTRSLFLTKGMMSILPIMSMWWFLFTASNMAAPPSINLLSEIMLITSVLSYSITSLLLISLISFFTAAYSLLMFSSMQHGQPSSFTNPLQVMKSKDYLLLLAHLYPIIFIIAKPEIIGNWL